MAHDSNQWVLLPYTLKAPRMGLSAISLSMEDGIQTKIDCTGSGTLSVIYKKKINVPALVSTTLSKCKSQTLQPSY